MRKVFLTLLLIVISRICSAPNIDFRLKLLTIRSTDGIDRREIS